MNRSSAVLSDFEVARLEDPEATSAQLVTRLAANLVAELELTPPISHDMITSMRDIAQIEEVDIPWAGCILDEGTGLIVRVRATDPPPRRRFTIFHEATHTFMPGFAMTPQYRCDPTSAHDLSGRDNDLEWLCDQGATEFLLPQAHFLPDILDEIPSFGVVEDLAATYDASLEATARRLASLHPSRPLLIGFKVMTKPSQPASRPQLRVDWAQPDSSWPYIPKYKSVPDRSPLLEVLEGAIVDHFVDLDGVAKSTLKGVYVSARSYPFKDRSGCNQERVLALVTKGDEVT